MARRDVRGARLTRRRRFPTVRHRVTRDAVRRYAELPAGCDLRHADEQGLDAGRPHRRHAHGSFCLEPCFDSLTAGLGVVALPAGTQVRMRLLRQLSLDDTVQFAVTAVTEAGEWLLVEGECSESQETVAAIVARIPRQNEAAPER